MAASAWTPVDESQLAAKWTPVEESQPASTDIAHEPWSLTGLAQTLATKEGLHALISPVEGFGEGALQTVHGTGELIRKGGNLLHPGLGDAIVPPQGQAALKSIATPENAGQKIGSGLEGVAEFLAGDDALKGLTAGQKLVHAGYLAKALQGSPRLQTALKIGIDALRTGTVGTAQGIVKGQEPAEAVKSGIAAAGTGGAIDAATEGLPAVASYLRSSAAKNYEAIIKPTTRAAKYDTQKIMPQLLEERPMAATRQGLADKAAAQAEEKGQQIEQAVQGLKGSMNTQPVVDGLNLLKRANQVRGVSLRPEMDAAIDSVSDSIKKMGPQISLQDAVKARRILDSAVAEAKGYSGANISDASVTAIRKQAANSLRSQLAQASPDLAKLNSTFHFWNTLSDVLDQTNLRMTGQSKPLGQMIETAAATAGGVAKAGAKGGAGWAGTMFLLGKAVRSTAWRSTAGATKSAIADALASGQFERAADLIRSAVPAVAAQ